MNALPPGSPDRTHFYKYSNCDHLEWLRDIILDHRLYLPTLDQLNDPKDARPDLLPLSEDEWVEFLMCSNPCGLTRAEMRIAVRRMSVQTLLENATRSFHQGMTAFGIYSMTRRYDNLALWGEYAACHSGYCLEFLNTGPLFQHAKEVVYQDSVQMRINDVEDKSWIFRKRLKYRHEEEIRLVSIPRQGRSVTIDPAWFNRLILGKNIQAAHEEQIRSWSNERRPSLVIVKAEYDAVSGRLTLKE
jgi:hypothetical protein